MFIHLDQLGWSGNGEGKGAWGLPIVPRSGQREAHLPYLWLLLEGSYVGPDLVVRRGSGMAVPVSCWRREATRLSSACGASARSESLLGRVYKR